MGGAAAAVTLTADNLGKLPFGIEVSRRVKTVIRQNLYIFPSVITLLVVSTRAGCFWNRGGSALARREYPGCDGQFPAVASGWRLSVSPVSDMRNKMRSYSDRTRARGDRTSVDEVQQGPESCGCPTPAAAV